MVVHGPCWPASEPCCCTVSMCGFRTQADAGTLADIHRRAGDALHAKHDFAGAVAEVMPALNSHGHRLN